MVEVTNLSLLNCSLPVVPSFDMLCSLSCSADCWCVSFILLVFFLITSGVVRILPPKWTGLRVEVVQHILTSIQNLARLGTFNTDNSSSATKSRFQPIWMLGIPECDLAGAERERVMCTQSVTGLQSLTAATTGWTRLWRALKSESKESSANQKKVKNCIINSTSGHCSCTLINAVPVSSRCYLSWVNGAEIFRFVKSLLFPPAISCRPTSSPELHRRGDRSILEPPN